MGSPTTNERRGGNGVGWLIIGGLAALGMVGKFLEILASKVSEVGPSGANVLAVLGIASCGAFAAVALGPVGRAVGKRILQGGAGPAASDDELQDLRLQVEDMRHVLAEAQERIDFTERMIAGSKERGLEELH